jgi:hypothetical protein
MLTELALESDAESVMMRGYFVLELARPENPIGREK